MGKVRSEIKIINFYSAIFFLFDTVHKIILIDKSGENYENN